MTNRQENTFTMMKTTSETVRKKAASDGMPQALKTVNDSLTDKLREIEVKDQEKGVLTSGKTNVKRQASKKLIASLLIVSGGMKTYAEINNNLELQALSSVKKSHLTGVRDTELAQKAEQILNTAQQLITELADYGITADHLTQLQEQLNAYRSAMDAQESSMATRVSVRETVTTLFQEANDIIKQQLDPLMETIKPIDQEFYNAYKAARVIKDLRGSGSRRQTAEAVEEVTVGTGS